MSFPIARICVINKQFSVELFFVANETARAHKNSALRHSARAKQTTEHVDRQIPLKNYCTGLLLPQGTEEHRTACSGAIWAGADVRRMHQSLHHLVADAPWSDDAVLGRCLETVIPAMLRRDPVVAWVVDDTGFPKKGRESVGVARQYCGQVGKQDNCRVAVRSFRLQPSRPACP